ncbi:MAG TPA: tetratricopeptide repeat protein [Bryobacteraceae bacterium]|nr:tetratricopeptide repeat protein [Bryobacteraceae bacterium]
MWSILALFLLQAPDHNAQGMKALDAANYSAAVTEFQAAVAADPNDYGAHFNLGLAFTFLHRDDEGIVEYRKTLDLKPHLYEAELNAGILLLRRKDAAAAEPLEADAAQQKPAEFRPRYYLAEAQFALEKWSEAAANYTLALEIDPKSGNAELGLGRALAHGHKVDEAAPHYRKAAALDPKNQDWLLELADLYEKDQKPQEALAIYREFPDNPAVQAHLGELMINGKQYAEAIPRLEAAFGREPSQANRVALAMAYLFDKQFAKALPLMQAAVEAQPSHFEIRMMYARALRDSRQYAAAQAQFAEAVKLKPADAPAWRDMGDMLYLTGDYPRALEAFEKARALGEDTAGNCFLRAIILDKLHQLKPALETYERFLEMSQGRNPDQEFQARHRIVAIRNELKGH